MPFCTEPTFRKIHEVNQITCKLMLPFKTHVDFIKAGEILDKVVLVRADLDSLDDRTGKIKNQIRLRLAARTVKQLISSGARNVVLCGHLGRPKGKKVETLSVVNICEKLEKFLGVDKGSVVIAPDVGEERNKIQSTLNPGQVLLLENLRFSPLEKSKDEGKRLERASALLAGCDLLVLDAAATLHRAKDVSVCEVVKMGPSCAGPTVLEFIESVRGILQPNTPTMVIFGGSKMGSKAKAMLGLAHQVSEFCVLGLPSISFHYANGIKLVGRYIPSKEEINIARKIIKARKFFGDNGLIISDQFVVTNSLDVSGKRIVSVYEGIDGDLFTPDVSLDFLKMLVRRVEEMDSVFVNGTPGIWEDDKHSKGSVYLVRALENSGKRIIFGGGDATGLADSFSQHGNNLVFITAGGATMEALASGVDGWRELPGVRALVESSEINCPSC